MDNLSSTGGARAHDRRVAARGTVLPPLGGRRRRRRRGARPRGRLGAQLRPGRSDALARTRSPAAERRRAVRRRPARRGVRRVRRAPAGAGHRGAGLRDRHRARDDSPAAHRRVRSPRSAAARSRRPGAVHGDHPARRRRHLRRTTGAPGVAHRRPARGRAGGAAPRRPGAHPARARAAVGLLDRVVRRGRCASRHRDEAAHAARDRASGHLRRARDAAQGRSRGHAPRHPRRRRDSADPRAARTAPRRPRGGGDEPPRHRGGRPGLERHRAGQHRAGTIPRARDRPAAGPGGDAGTGSPVARRCGSAYRRRIQ